MVLEKYKNSNKTIDNRYQIALPFKKDEVEMPNNYSYVLNRMLKLDQRLKKDDELHTKYFKFMGDLFGSGHAVTVDEAKPKNMVRYGTSLISA